MELRHCDHSKVYFENGFLTCVECGKNRTPLANTRVLMVFDDFRELKLHELEKILNDLTDDDLKEMTIYTDYLKFRRVVLDELQKDK